MHRPWEIEQYVLTKQKKYNDLYELFIEKKKSFRKYPDILAKTANEICPILRKNGFSDKADLIMRNLNSSVSSKRDDIKRNIELDSINRITETGDHKKARKKMERLLRKQKKEANKLVPIIDDYLKLTKKSNQTHEAARFLKGYVKRIINDNDFSPGYEKKFYDLLIRAYENDGDTRAVDRLRKKINRK